MTNQELKNEFLIHYNAIATMSAPSIDDYEMSVYFTKAQLELIKNKYNPLGNKYNDGFEGSEKRRVDLKQLLVNHLSTTKLVNTGANITKDSQIFTIPNNVFVIVSEVALVDSDDCLDGKQIDVIPKTHDEFNVQYKNPFKKPDADHVWRLDYSKLNGSKVVELVSPYNITEYRLRYIKYPLPIVLTDLTTAFPGEGLSIDGITANTPCELEEEIQREIIDRSVQLALRDYKVSNLESKIQLDQRNE
jgi:hypothetical protein